MLPAAHLDQYIEKLSPDLQDIVRELRDMIVTIAPDAVEVFRWGGFSYFHAGRGGPVSAGICQIGLEADHVRLGFIHGAFLPDPQGLLEGERKVKRFVRLDSYERAPWEAIRELIAASACFDPRTQSFTDSPIG